MLRIFSKPIPLAVLLYFCTLIPIVVTAVRAIQITTVGLPDGSAHLRGVPVQLFLHSIGGVVFGLLGPLQFTNALRGRVGKLHRVLGWAFAIAGATLGLSGLLIIFQVAPKSMLFVDMFRFFAGLGLLTCIWQAIAAAKGRNVAQHRAWMIRAYVFGMGSGAVALVTLPIILLTGEMLTGPTSDLVFVGAWTGSILLAEWVILRLRMALPWHASALL